MTSTKTAVAALAAFTLVAVLTPANLHAAVVKATYSFNNTLAAAEPGVPALTLTDPLGTSTYVTDIVLGESRTVLNIDGHNSPATDQGGLTLATASLISPQNYSVDLVFKFNLVGNSSGWRRILDVQNRVADAGFYVDPSNDLDVFPVSGSAVLWTNEIYHHVVLTVNNDNAADPQLHEVRAYLDGVAEFTAATTVMNLDVDPANNPSALLHFFLDNTQAGGQGEWAAPTIALARVWNGVLTPTEANLLATNPFVPEPTTATTLLLPTALLFRRKR